MTLLVCEPMIHAVAYCENKAFFKQASEYLIQGLLPGGDEDENEEEFKDEEEFEECEEECEEGKDSDSANEELEVEISVDDEKSEDSEFDSENSEFDSENAEFDSEEFDNISDESCGDSCDEDHGHENGEFVFDYSLLAKSIFDFGAREDVLTRNRRFLYELSQIIEHVATGTFESCCTEEGGCEGETCCN